MAKLMMCFALAGVVAASIIQSLATGLASRVIDLRERGSVEPLIQRLRREGSAQRIVGHGPEWVMPPSGSIRVMRRDRTVAQIRTGEIDIQTIVATLTGTNAEQSA